MPYGRKPETTRYERLAATFDPARPETVPEDVWTDVLDHYSDCANVQEFEVKYDVPHEIVRWVLAQPDLMQRALDRRRGEFTLKLVNDVLPSVIAKAAEGGSGSVQAAKLTTDILGFVERGKIGRPKDPEAQEAGPTLESQLAKLNKQAQDSHSSKASPKSKLPRKGR